MNITEDPFELMAQQLCNKGFAVLPASVYLPFSHSTVSNVIKSLDSVMNPAEREAFRISPEYGMFSKSSIFPGMAKHYLRYTESLEQEYAKGRLHHLSPSARALMTYSQIIFTHGEMLTQLLIAEMEKVMPGKGIRKSFPNDQIRKYSALHCIRHEKSEESQSGGNGSMVQRSFPDPAGLVFYIFEDTKGLQIGRPLESVPAISSDLHQQQWEFKTPTEQNSAHDLVVMAGMGMETVTDGAIKAVPFTIAPGDNIGSLRSSIVYQVHTVNTHISGLHSGFE